MYHCYFSSAKFRLDCRSYLRNIRSCEPTNPHLVMEIDPIVIQNMGNVVKSKVPIPRYPFLLIANIVEGVAAEEHGDGYYWRYHIKVTDENGHIIAKTDPSNAIVARDDLGATNWVLANDLYYTLGEPETSLDLAADSIAQYPIGS